MCRSKCNKQVSRYVGVMGQVAIICSNIIGCRLCDGVRCERIQVCHYKRIWTYGKSEHSPLL